MYDEVGTAPGAYGDLPKRRTQDDPTPFGPHAEDLNTTRNYSYDELGNLVKDQNEGIAAITWSVAGKVKQVQRTDGTRPELTFGYGAAGHRIMKQVADPWEDAEGYREHYVHDAQGNIMAIYRHTVATPSGPELSFQLTERPLYGSDRLGTDRYTVELAGNPSYDPGTALDGTGLKSYELKDHLGNVMAVVSDALQPVDIDGDLNTDAFTATTISLQDYEPGGSLLPGRNYSSSSYRFGFGGMPKDDEMHGATGTSYDFGARLYDPRVSRWLSLDPLASTYPDLSPYCFVGGNPIAFVDPNGREIVIHYGDNQQYIYGSKDPVPDDAFVMETVMALNQLVANAQDPDRIIQSMALSNQFTWSIGEGNATSGANDVYTIPFGAMNTAFTTWDPRAGVQTTEGGVQSPTTQLLHEGAHAWLTSLRSEIIRNASKLASEAETAEDSQRVLDEANSTLNAIDMLMNTTIGEWDEIEERYVIEKYETPYAKSQGEGVRNNHRGSFFRTDSPVSTTPERSPVEREQPTGAPYAN